MKKTLLAIAMTGLFGATAQAATVYDADGTIVEIYGDLEVYAGAMTADDTTTTGNEQDLTMYTDDSDFGFKIIQTVNSDIAAFGDMSFNDDAARDTAVVGLTNDLGTIAFGIQYTVFDDVGFFNDYVFGISNAVQGDSYADQVVKVNFANGNVYGAVAYALNQTDGLDDETSTLDGKIGITLDNLDVVLFAGTTDYGTYDGTDLLIEITYSADALGVGFTASTSDYNNDTTAFGAQITYAVDKFTYSIAAGTSDSDNSDDLVEYFAGVEYALANNTTVYAQLGGNDDDDSDLGYAAGMQISF